MVVSVLALLSLFASCNGARFDVDETKEGQVRCHENHPQTYCPDGYRCVMTGNGCQAKSFVEVAETKEGQVKCHENHPQTYCPDGYRCVMTGNGCQAKSFVEVAETNDEERGCDYIEPADATNQKAGGFPEMLDFGNDKTILTYAFGKAFKNSGQVMVWSYDEAEQKVWMWFGKPNCKTRTEEGTCKNIPTSGGTFGSCQACPSCKDKGMMGGCSRKGGPTFKLGDIIEIGSFGKMKLVKAGDAFKLEMPDSPGKYLAPIYTCGKRSHATKFV